MLEIRSRLSFFYIPTCSGLGPLFSSSFSYRYYIKKSSFFLLFFALPPIAHIYRTEVSIIISIILISPFFFHRPSSAIVHTEHYHVYDKYAIYLHMIYLYCGCFFIFFSMSTTIMQYIYTLSIYTVDVSISLRPMPFALCACRCRRLLFAALEYVLALVLSLPVLGYTGLCYIFFSFCRGRLLELSRGIF